ncbi:MAG: hypothetical protein AB1705_02185 [Verrucomicrobiota bacterium]
MKPALLVALFWIGTQSLSAADTVVVTWSKAGGIAGIRETFLAISDSEPALGKIHRTSKTGIYLIDSRVAGEIITLLKKNGFAVIPPPNPHATPMLSQNPFPSRAGT